ncbi:MAG TPA: choice-of-anchor P family protein [Acidimicrobiales bacterium]|nr:choice-of-anchor P family protein [Acidimicrobiales bacterium]
MAEPRFEVFQKAGWHWRLVDANGRIVVSSFRYATKANARKAAQKAKDNAAVAEIVEARPNVDVIEVAGAAFGASVDVTISGLGNIASPPAPAVALPRAGGTQNKSLPRARIGPGGLFLTSDVLNASASGAVGPAGAATSSAAVAEIDLLGETLVATSVASTCTANETGATGSTTIDGGMLVLDENQIVPLPAAPAPNTTYQGTNADTGDTFTVILNEQVAGAGMLTVTAVHVVLEGPTATGDILVGRSESGVTTSP